MAATDVQDVHTSPIEEVKSVQRTIKAVEENMIARKAQRILPLLCMQACIGRNVHQLRPDLCKNHTTEQQE